MVPRYRYRSTNPFLIWTTLTLKTWEMMLASAQVIGHRTGRMALAGPAPDARDRREFHRMGQEKLEAAAESLQAIGLRVYAMNQQIALLAYRQFVASVGGFMALAGSRSMAHTAKLQSDLMRNAMSHAASALNQLGGAVARTAHKGLMPIHSRATANARRLARSRR
ncbi:MAG TPA: polyhydroxyalkanoate granule-associated phasin [Paucimonas sp.]|nr:polyhydroxyalkanoate granule-associated phasin [Paucimonas sp.]